MSGDNPRSTEILAGCMEHPLGGGAMLYVSESATGDRGQHVRLQQGSVRAGSAESCDLTLKDPAVSRQHVSFTMQADGVLVQDLGSTNGTFYLGQKIDRIVVRTGTRIALGRSAIDILPLDAPDDDVPSRDGYGELVGSSLPMRRLYAVLQKLEGSEAPVLLTGETGTGKELVARAIHDHSPRKGKPFVIVDCGQVNAELISSDLFGHKRGGFTGAVADRQGAFETADGGTLVLDELGELPIDLQPKLLRVLEAGMFTRVGDSQPRKVDVRVIASTHRDLGEGVRAGAFREDLFYRVAVVHLTVPPLRMRREDVPQLVAFLAKKLGKPEALPQAALDFMMTYDWPGNVRELRNAVHRLMVLGTLGLQSQSITSPTPIIAPAGADADLKYRDAKEQAIRDFEAAYLKAVWQRASGNISQAARLADMDRKYLRELLKKHGLH